MFPDVPTLKEKGGDFSYFMQRAVVGAPGMSDDAAAFYTDLFKKVYASADWQDYKSKKSLMALKLPVRISRDPLFASAAAIWPAKLGNAKRLS